MTRSLLERLGAALSQQYDVERELAAGGMGTVFLARDITLERRVAIKILRPELAPATAAERFLREARILAKLSHPNVVPVHAAGEADGLFYYVMDHVEEDTLAVRLNHGPLTAEQIVSVGSDLLSALEAAHAAGVVHRDVKPSNVLVVGERVLLGDFGVAKAEGEDSPRLTDDGQRAGTPAYMAPEQIDGEATPKSDLFAVGMILYESLTGQHWSLATPVAAVDWRGVPPHLRRVLRHALALAPGDRWADAATFRWELTRSAQSKTKRQLRRFAPSAVVVIAVLGTLGYWLIQSPATSSTERSIAILPVEIRGDWASAIDGRDLALYVADRLERAPNVSVVPTLHAFSWWDSVAAQPGSTGPEVAAAALGARYAAQARLYVVPGSSYIDLAVFDAHGATRPGAGHIALARGDLLEISDSITLRLLRIALEGEVRQLTRLTGNAEALIDYLLGERAFQGGDWGRARDYYESAVARDSTFVQAWWHLANAWHWLGLSGPPPEDFQKLHAAYGSRLGATDSLLMAAQLTPAGPERLRIYQEAIEGDPLNYFAAYLYGEELFNRGPLFGRSLEQAAQALEIAVTLNPRWASAYVHLVWANIRLARKEGARRSLDGLHAIAVASEQGWLYPPELLEHAYLERFGSPESTAAARADLVSSPVLGTPERLAVISRLGLALDLPEAELAFAGALEAQAELIPAVHASSHAAQGLSLVALGRPATALAHFDSAAGLLGTAEARIQAAEWRLLSRAVLELPMDTLQLSYGRQELIGLLADESLGGRAAWVLAMEAYAEGNTGGAQRYAQRLRRVEVGLGAAGLLDFLQATRAATQGDKQAALRISEPLLQMQVHTRQLEGGPAVAVLPDPFARAMLHLLRGAWFEHLGDTQAADREWLWYEAVDMIGYPGLGAPQASEIDWALANYGRYRRGLGALARGDREAACRHLGFVARSWAGADPEVEPLARRARESADLACD
jgi:tRNA A-37 threonylcarbamoyl transferase component Bud32